MTAPWEVNKRPSLDDVIRRLRERAEYGARANNYATGGQSAAVTPAYKPEDFQMWWDAAAIEELANNRR
jgi:hypothetical protein